METIHTYTRAQALDDGVLVDATQQAREVGFTVPFALTAAAFSDCVEWSDTDQQAKGDAGQSQAGRLWDVLWLAYLAARTTDSDRVAFVVHRVPRNGPSLAPEAAHLVLHIHPGDKGEPVLTVLQPDED